MALTGMHVEWRYQKKGAVNAAPILGVLVSSEDPASQTATTVGAPALSTAGDPMVNLIAAADSFVSIGPSPADPSLVGTARFFVLAKVPTPMFCNPGDQVRWVAA